MNNIKQAYYYFFYTLYKRSEKSSTLFPYNFISSLYIIILQIFLIGSFTNYYNIIFHTDSAILSNKVWITIVAILVIIDYLIFHYKNQWKDIVINFDKLSQEHHRKYKRIVYIITLIIISNLIFSFYLYYQS